MPTLEQQSAFPLNRDGIDTWIIETAYGRVLVEVREGVTLVNGSPVEPYAETLETMRAVHGVAKEPAKTKE